MSEAVVKELEAIHAKSVELTEKWFPETSKYPRDKRLTIITLMSYLIDLERLQIERARGVREAMKMQRE